MIFAVQEGAPIYLAAVIGRLTRRPVVGRVHITWSELLRGVSPWHRWASSLHSLADKLIGISEGVAGDLVKHSPRLRDKVVAIRHPYAPSQWLQAQARAAPPTWTDHVFTKRTLLAVGSLTHRKGFDVLLAAFAELVQKWGLDLHLLILGEGEERPKLESLAERLGVNSRLFMPGFQENPYPLFARAEIFVLSSRLEGLATVILEAMAFGLPVIATECSHAIRAIMKDGRYGILVPVDDSDVLAEAVYTLIESTERRAALSAAGAALAEEYDVDNVKSFEDLLLECAKRKDD